MSTQQSQMPTAVIFDTETSGLPARDRNSKGGIHPCPKSFHLYDGARIVQFAYLVMDMISGKTLKEHSALVRPTGTWSMHPGAEETHGVSFSRALSDGLPLSDIMADFVPECERAEYIVCHNTAFDLSVILSEIYRDNAALGGYLGTISSCRFLCTMQTMTAEMNLPYPNSKNRGKWPRLQELYSYLFEGEQFYGAHDALFDVRATSRCFIEIMRRRRRRAIGRA